LVVLGGLCGRHRQAVVFVAGEVRRRTQRVAWFERGELARENRETLGYVLLDVHVA
jgi:hypothetical protein